MDKGNSLEKDGERVKLEMIRLDRVPRTKIRTNLVFEVSD